MQIFKDIQGMKIGIRKLVMFIKEYDVLEDDDVMLAYISFSETTTSLFTSGYTNFDYEHYNLYKETRNLIESLQNYYEIYDDNRDYSIEIERLEDLNDIYNRFDMKKIK